MDWNYNEPKTPQCDRATQQTGNWLYTLHIALSVRFLPTDKSMVNVYILWKWARSTNKQKNSIERVERERLQTKIMVRRPYNTNAHGSGLLFVWAMPSNVTWKIISKSMQLCVDTCYKHFQFHFTFAPLALSSRPHYICWPFKIAHRTLYTERFKWIDVDMVNFSTRINVFCIAKL